MLNVNFCDSSGSDRGNKCCHRESDWSLVSEVCEGLGGSVDADDRSIVLIVELFVSSQSNQSSVDLRPDVREYHSLLSPLFQILQGDLRARFLVLLDHFPFLLLIIILILLFLDGPVVKLFKSSEVIRVDSGMPCINHVLLNPFQTRKLCLTVKTSVALDDLLHTLD